jgi:hypothetical protein
MRHQCNLRDPRGKRLPQGRGRLRDAPTQVCAPSSRPAGSAPSWRWPAIIVWSPAGTPTAPTPCSRMSRRGHGTGVGRQGRQRPCRVRLGVLPPRPRRSCAWWADRQGPGRPRPAPGPPLPLLVPAGNAGHARPRLPGRGSVDRTGPRSCAARAGRPHVSLMAPGVRCHAKRSRVGRKLPSIGSAKILVGAIW